MQIPAAGAPASAAEDVVNDCGVAAVSEQGFVALQRFVDTLSVCVPPAVTTGVPVAENVSPNVNGESVGYDPAPITIASTLPVFWTVYDPPHEVMFSVLPVRPT
jgi:hypothetical protein